MSDSQSTQQADDSASSAAAQAAGETAGVAAEQGRNVASTAADQAKAVAGEAKSQAMSVTSEARQQASRVVDDASSELRQQLEQRLTELAHSARGTAGELRALHEGRTDEAGRAGNLARQASDRLGQMADKADELGLGGMTEEAVKFARRRPLMFLGGAVAAGFLAGRTLRNAKAASDAEQPTSERGLPTGSPSGYGDRELAGTRPVPSEIGTLEGPTGAVAPEETALGITGVTVPGAAGPAPGPGGVG